MQLSTKRTPLHNDLFLETYKTCEFKFVDFNGNRIRYECNWEVGERAQGFDDSEKFSFIDKKGLLESQILF
jgi:hypothetical protein